MDSLPFNVRDLIWKHVSGDSQSTAGAMFTTWNVGSLQEQSRLCLFPTSVAKLHDTSKVSKTRESGKQYFSRWSRTVTPLPS
jgi:hypothetical protein